MVVPISHLLKCSSNFNADTENTVNFEFSKYKSTLIWKTNANGVLKNVTIHRGYSFLKRSVKNLEKLATTNLENEEKLCLSSFSIIVYIVLKGDQGFVIQFLLRDIKHDTVSSFHKITFCWWLLSAVFNAAKVFLKKLYKTWQIICRSAKRSEKNIQQISWISGIIVALKIPGKEVCYLMLLGAVFWPHITIVRFKPFLNYSMSRLLGRVLIVTFNLTILQIFLEKFIEIPQIDVINYFYQRFWIFWHFLVTRKIMTLKYNKWCQNFLLPTLFK